MYEIWNLGHPPFEGITNDQVCIKRQASRQIRGIEKHEKLTTEKILNCSHK